MANKKILLGMLTGLLAFAMVLAGCENGTQEVKIATDKVSAPRNVSVTKSGSSTSITTYYINFEFDAVDNASGYRFYVKEKGGSLILENNTLTNIYEPSPGKLYASYSSSSSSSFWTAGITYEIGLQVTGLIDSGGFTSGFGIAWKELTL